MNEGTALMTKDEEMKKISKQTFLIQIFSSPCQDEHRFGQAKIANGGLVLGLSWFSILP